MTASSRTKGSLPRRCFLGVELGPDTEAFSSEGVVVVAVAHEGMARAAGVQPGCRISLLAGYPLRSLREMGFALREAGKELEVEIEFLQGEHRRRERVAVVPSPQEKMEGQEIFYEHVEIAGTRLRSIVTRPTDVPARGVILFVQGIACESVDYGPHSEEPMACLLRGWAAAGFVTMRVDKRGLGDSEGAACALGDFEAELFCHQAALRALAADPRFAGLDIFLFGHSIGGMVAPILASQCALRGVMVYGSSTKNWVDCVVDSTRRQYQLREMPVAEIEGIVATLRTRMLGEGFNGRSAAYHRQLDALDLPALWQAVHQVRLLVLCGEHDWVLSRDEQMEIASHVDTAECIDLPGLDHMLGWHASREASLMHYGQGHFTDEILVATLEWLSRGNVQSKA